MDVVRPAIRAVVGASFDRDSMQHCLSTMFNSHDEEEDCQHRLQRHFASLIALYGMNVSISSMMVNDLTPNGPFFSGLRGANRSYDTSVGEFLMSLERWEAGVRFSNVMSTSDMVLITKAEVDNGWAPNLGIATGQFSNAVFLGIVTVVLTLVALRFVEDRIFNGRSTIFGYTITANIALVSLSFTVFYQAVISQYLLVNEPINMELALERALSRASSGESDLHFGGVGAISKKFLNGVDSISRAVQAADHIGHVKYNSRYGELLEHIEANGDMFIVSDDVLAFMRAFKNASTCKRYQIFALDKPGPNAFALSASLDASIVEEINSRIAHRQEAIFAVQAVVANNLTEVCRRHFHPDTLATVAFTQLRLPIVSGAFWLLGGMIAVSTLALCVEVVTSLLQPLETGDEKTSSTIQVQRDERLHREEEVMRKLSRLMNRAKNEYNLEYLNALLDTIPFSGYVYQ